MKMDVARMLMVTVVALAVTPLQAKTGHCSNANTGGDWAYTYVGTIFTQNGPLPAASVGHFNQDANGKLTGSQTRSVAGDSGSEDISGTVSVNKDCTATATIQVFVDGQLQRTAVLAGVYDKQRNHARYIFKSLTLPDGTNVPVVLTSDGNRMFPQD